MPPRLYEDHVKRPLTTEQQALAADNVRLAYFLAGKFARRYELDHDECDGEALFALTNAARLFDPRRVHEHKGGGFVRFGTYATWAITNRLVRLGHVERRRAERHARHYDGYGNDAPTVPPRLCDDGPAVEELCRHGGQDAGVLRMRYGEGLSLQKVADRLGVSKERVRQRQERGLAACRLALGHDAPGVPARVGGRQGAIAARAAERQGYDTDRDRAGPRPGVASPPAPPPGRRRP